MEESHTTNKIIFVDEIGFNVSLRVKKGRAPIDRVTTKVVSNIRTSNISVCAAMTRNGMYYKEIKNRTYSTNFLKIFKFHIFILNETVKSSCVFIVDNVYFHKSESIGRIMEENSHCIKYLPPYSPSLNLIEEVFSMWKNYVRRKNCNNFDLLIEAIKVDLILSQLKTVLVFIAI